MSSSPPLFFTAKMMMAPLLFFALCSFFICFSFHAPAASAEMHGSPPHQTLIKIYLRIYLFIYLIIQLFSDGPTKRQLVDVGHQAAQRAVGRRSPGEARSDRRRARRTPFVLFAFVLWSPGCCWVGAWLLMRRMCHMTVSCAGAGGQPEGLLPDRARPQPLAQAQRARRTTFSLFFFFFLYFFIRSSPPPLGLSSPDRGIAARPSRRRVGRVPACTLPAEAVSRRHRFIATRHTHDTHT